MKSGLLLAVMLMGCVTDPKPSALLDTLKLRDSQTLDLVLVGKNLVKVYGRERAERLVLDTWTDLTYDAPLERAGDVIWLQGQSPRIQDVAWLVKYRGEWL